MKSVCDFFTTHYPDMNPCTYDELLYPQPCACHVNYNSEHDAEFPCSVASQCYHGSYRWKGKFTRLSLLCR